MKQEQRPFEIDHVDPLGQGVSKKNKITFIEKTSSWRKGKATIYKEAKGVSFGFIKNQNDLEAKSEDRIFQNALITLNVQGVITSIHLMRMNFHSRKDHSKNTYYP